MAGYPDSVPVGGFVAPNDTLDTYPTQDSRFTKGGHHEVATLAERDNITSPRRREGLTCYVASEQKIYRLQGGTANANWIAIGADPVQYASRPPNRSDDSTQAYTVNTLWQDTTSLRAYLLIDNTAGAAIWLPLVNENGGKLQYVLGYGFGAPQNESFQTLQAAIDAGFTTIFCGGFEGGYVTINNLFGFYNFYGNPNNGFYLYDPGSAVQPILDMNCIQANFYHFTAEQYSTASTIRWTNATGFFGRFGWSSNPANINTGGINHFSTTANPVVDIYSTPTSEVALIGARVNAYGDPFLLSSAFINTIEDCYFVAGASAVQTMLSLSGDLNMRRCFVDSFGPPFDFNTILQGQGVNRIHDTWIRKVENTGFRLTANNAILVLNDVYIEPGVQTNDILVDPALVGCIVFVQGSQLDHSKITYPAGTNFSASFISTAAGSEKLYTTFVASNPAQWAGVPLYKDDAINRLANEVFILKGGVPIV